MIKKASIILVDAFLMGERMKLEGGYQSLCFQALL